MDILQEAQKIEWKQTGEKIASSAREIGIDNIDLKFVEVLRYFGITSKDKMTRETMEKVNLIYDYFKNEEDILGELQRLNSRLGNPIELEEKLNKIYSFVYSENLEESFQKEEELKDKRTAELFEKARKEKEAMEKEKLRQIRKEKEKARLEAIKKEKEERYRKYLKTKAENEMMERMKIIEKRKPPKEPKLPEVNIYA